jgi:hypothetical protein
MYAPVKELLAAKLPDFNVSNTHAATYLDAQAPDITIPELVLETSIPSSSIRCIVGLRAAFKVRVNFGKHYQLSSFPTLSQYFPLFRKAL